jgi:LysR family glycine cleavage system transcriptional activator
LFLRVRTIPPLAAVRVFEAAARHLNFTAAAQELGMTQAAVSYQIRLIEERLGTSLFARTRRGVELTTAGRRAAPLVTSAFDLIDDAFSGLREESETVLSVTSMISFATAWLARRLGQFQLAHPGIALRMHTSNNVDVAIRTGRDPAAWPGTVAHFMHRVHFTPMASPAFIAKMDGLTDPAQLIDVERLASDVDWWDLWFEAAGVPLTRSAAPSTRLDAQSLEAQLVMTGQGITLLTPPLWTHELAAGHLVRPFETVAFDGTCLWLVYPESKRNLRKVRLFRDWVLAEFARHGIDDATGAFVPPDAPSPPRTRAAIRPAR